MVITVITSSKGVVDKPTNTFRWCTPARTTWQPHKLQQLWVDTQDNKRWVDVQIEVDTESYDRENLE